MNERDRSSGRVLLWVAAALVFAAGLTLFALLPKSERRVTIDTDEQVQAPPAAESVVPTAQPQARIARPILAPSAPIVRPPEKAPLAVVDFFTAEVPEELRKMHEVTSSGGLLALPRMKELYQLGKDHPGDPRPHLLMGQDAVNRGWDAFAIGHYQHAVREDPRARQDPRMLKDLVDIAGGKSEPAKAAKAITDIYGAAAVPAIEDAIAAAGDKSEADRVDRLLSLSRVLGEKAP